MIDPGTKAGALVGHLNTGTVSDCFIEGGQVNSNVDTAGGLIGYNNGTIQNCYVNTNVFGKNNIGGLVGYNYGTIIQCTSESFVTGYGNVGGLVGYNFDTIDRCSSQSTVSGDVNVGGLVGKNSNLLYEGNVGLTNSYYEGDVVATKQYVGGAVGHNNGLIKNCYAKGTVIGDTYVGGLVGGGVGEFVSHCFSTCVVSAKSKYGGLIGGYSFSTLLTLSHTARIDRCYWDMETSGMNVSWGGVGLTTEQMRDPDSYPGWGCDQMWTIKPDNGYPHLTREDQPGETIHTETYSGGCGDANKPYLLTCAEDLYEIGYHPSDWDKHFKLMANIDMTSVDDKEYLPIGSVFGSSNYFHFTGSFNGNGYVIKNLFCRSSRERFVGLFGISKSPARIYDLGIVGATILAGDTDYVGALIGEGVCIDNCYVQNVYIVGKNHTGGLAGYIGGTDCGLVNCYAQGKVFGRDIVGGLTGSVSGNNYGLVNCHAFGEIIGRDNVGGCVGIGNATDCYFHGDVSGNSFVGGFAGKSGSEVLNDWRTLGTWDQAAWSWSAS